MSVSGECPMSREFYYPVLRVLSDGKERPSGELYDDVAADMKLSDKAMREMTDGKNAFKYTNRSNMAAFHMRKLGWIELVRRGVFRITADGKKVFAEHPDGFSNEKVSRIMADARK